LSEALKAWKEAHSCKPTDRVVRVSSRALMYLDDDLVAAGIARRVAVDASGQPVPVDEKGQPTTTPAKWVIDKRDAAGRVVDLHALRHTCGSRLVAAGVDIKSVQQIMRHTTAALTLGIYVHSDKRRMHEAVASVPAIKPAALQPQKETFQATGTDSEIQPPSSRQGRAAAIVNHRRNSDLLSRLSGASNQEVGGSSPSGCI